jgi:hypothetical protein
MGKKRAAAVSVPFPAPASEPESDHFSDYGFDPQLLHFPSQVHLISSSSSQHYTTALHDCIDLFQKEQRSMPAVLHAGRWLRSCILLTCGVVPLFPSA